MAEVEGRSLGRWSRGVLVGVLAGALIATSASFAAADPTLTPTTPATSATEETPSAVVVKVTSPAQAYVGAEVKLTGTFTGGTAPTTVQVEAQAADGSWNAVPEAKPVVKDDHFTVAIPGNEDHKASTQTLRVKLTFSDGTSAVSDPFKLERVAPHVTVGISAPTSATVGVTLTLKGKLAGFLPGEVEVTSQVKVGNDWRNLSRSSVAVDADGASYAVAANYQTTSLGSKTFRVTAEQDGLAAQHSGSVNVLRVPVRSASIDKDRVALLSQKVSLNGTIKGFDGHVTVEAQVRNGNSWTTKASKRVPVRYNGSSYSVPISYNEHATGTVTWRVLVRQGRGSTPSGATKVTRTLKGIDKRCLSGRVMCISKKDKKLRWMINGKIIKTLDTRFGAAKTPTRNGSFTVFRKSRDHVSSLFGSKMPFAMFFSGGQAVHYSSDFARRGYAGASHGCVNIRDLNGIRDLFDKQVRLGDKVIVY